MNIALLLSAAWGIACALPLVHRAVATSVRARAHTLAGAGRVRRPRVRGVAGPWSRRGRPPMRVAVVATALVDRLRRHDRGRAVARGVPLALDVLTMAARAGYTPRLAVAAAARWSPAEVAAALDEVEQRCRLGASLVDALVELGRAEPALRSLTDGLVVAERSGAPIAELLARLADDARAALRRRAEAHARRVPVRLLFPLVFLVLPAFGLLTVVPALAAGLRGS